ELVRDLDTLDGWIARCRRQGYFAIDTETDALDAQASRLVGISLAVDANEACYIPLQHIDPEAQANGDMFGAEPPQQIDMQAALARLQPILQDPSILKIGQNIKYDISVLKRYGLDITPIDDTMLLSFVLHAGMDGHGMDELAERYFSHTPITFKDVCGSGKAQISFDRVALDKATEYAAEDADITLRLWHLMKPKLHKHGVTTVYETLERPLMTVLSDMEAAGIKVDAQKLSQLSAGFAQRMAALEDEAYQQAGRTFNMGSPKQLGEILFDEMGLPGGKKTKTGAWQTGAEILEDLAAEGQPLPRTILSWRSLSKLRSTYTETLQDQINPATGRVHTNYSMTGAQTGRLSSNDPNLQNIPIRTDEGRKIREAFIAEPGNQLISADYSQIELRLLAHIADIDALKSAFRNGLDIHAMTASEMFNVPIEGMDPMIRRRAKAINFGIIYGISAFGLARQLSIPRSEASDYIKAYFEKFPGIKAYMEDTKAKARETKTVETAFGRVLHLKGIDSKNGAERSFAERQAINAPI
ncbi:MAG: DNA polymerase, partial [Henriciella sp.]